MEINANFEVGIMKLNIDFDELIDAFEKSNIMSHYFIDTKEHELIYINEGVEDKGSEKGGEKEDDAHAKIRPALF